MILTDKVRQVFVAFNEDMQMFNLVIVDDVVKNLAVQLLDNNAYLPPQYNCGGNCKARREEGK
jgi:hypothetical protein